MGASITPENLTVRYATPPNSGPNLTTIDRLVLIRMRRDRVAARMLTPYEAGLSPQGRAELTEQRRIIAQLKRFGPPPQLQLPDNLQQRMAAFRDSITNNAPQGQRTRIGRNEPCPCGSGKKYKKCHGGGG